MPIFFDLLPYKLSTNNVIAFTYTLFKHTYSQEANKDTKTQRGRRIKKGA